MLNNPETISRSTSRLITVEEVKRHCRLNLADTAEDATIEKLIDIATEMAEEECQVSLVETEYRLYLCGFPAKNEAGMRPLYLERGPVISVEKVEYFNAAMAWTEIDADTYFVNLRDLFPSVIEAPDCSWPSDAAALPYNVRVEYTAKVVELKEQHRHALKEIVAGLRRAKGAVITEDLKMMPEWFGIRRLLRGLK